MSDEVKKNSSEDPTLPPASLGMLVSMLGTRPMIALGQMADPASGKTIVRINLARHYIDTISMLQEKTKGNVSHEEEALLTGVLHDLRMAFVAPRKG